MEFFGKIAFSIVVVLHYFLLTHQYEPYNGDGMKINFNITQPDQLKEDSEDLPEYSTKDTVFVCTSEECRRRLPTTEKYPPMFNAEEENRLLSRVDYEDFDFWSDPMTISLIIISVIMLIAFGFLVYLVVVDRKQRQTVGTTTSTLISKRASAIERQRSPCSKTLGLAYKTAKGKRIRGGGDIPKLKIVRKRAPSY